MRKLRNCILALLIGLTTPLLIWVGAGSALYQRSKRAYSTAVCSIDSDCPPGYECVNGRCTHQPA